MVKRFVPIYVFILIFVLCFSLNNFAAAVNEDVSEGIFEKEIETVTEEERPGDAEEETGIPDIKEPEEPLCEQTGEHVFDTYVFVENGIHCATCTLCGAVFEFDCEYADPPVFDENGDGTHSVGCILCGGKKTESCVYEAETVLPTQSEMGFTRYTCDICGYTFTDGELPPEREQAESRLVGDVDGDGKITSADARLILRACVGLEKLPENAIPYADRDNDGEISAMDARYALRVSVGLEDVPDRHEYDITVTEKPSCTARGSLSFICRYCGFEGDTAIPAYGHSYGEPVIKKATCTENGVSTLICKVCKYKSVSPIMATGHSYGTPVVIEATCTKAGSSTVKCSACAEKIVTELPKTGHSWTKDTKSNIISCKNCSSKCSGWVDMDKKTYHCVKGVPDYSWCAVDGSYYFFDRNTCALKKSCKVDGIKLGTDGKAPTDWYSAEKIRTFIKAKKVVASITSSSDSLDTKKLKCFKWVMAFPYKQYRLVGQAMQTKGFEMLFANDIFDRGAGCCGSDSYAFAFLAVEIGCREVYVCDDGVSTSGHAWVTMEGNNKVYDVVFAEAKSFSANYNAYVSDYRKYQPRMTYVGG